MNGESRIMNSIRNISTGFLGQFISMILGFINRTIFIKILGEEYLGVSGLFSNILSMLSLAELGIGSAIIYALYKPLAENDKDKISKLMNFYSKAYTNVGLFITILGILILPVLKFLIRETPYIKENIQIIYLIYLFNTSITYFFSYKNSLIVASQKNYISNLINYSTLIVQTVFQIAILITTKKFILYLVVQSICSFAYNIMISKKADKMYPYIKKSKGAKLDEEDRKHLNSNIKALMVTNLSGVLVNNTDNIIITYFSGISMVGICSNYIMLINLINSVLLQLFNGITASIGNFNAKEDKNRKEELFSIVNFCNFWLFGFCTICIYLLINDFITLWIGSKFVMSTEVVAILVVNFYIIGMQNSPWIYKVTLGIFREGRYLVLITAIINIFLSIILGKKLGTCGILLATAISRILTNVWYYPYIVYKVGFNKSIKVYMIKYIKYIAILFIALIPTRYLCNLVSLSMIPSFILKLFICLSIPNIVFMITLYNTYEMKYVLNMFKNISSNMMRPFRFYFE